MARNVLRARAQSLVPKPNKYRARKVTADGLTFDSAAEHRRYCELKLLERGRQISCLVVHPTFLLDVDGFRVGQYTPDFQYLDEAGTRVIEDVKGVMTKDASLRIRLFQAIFKVHVTIIGKNVPKVRKLKARAA